MPIDSRICMSHRSSFRACANATYSASGVDAEHLFRMPVPNAIGQSLLRRMRNPYRDLRWSGSDAWSESTYTARVHFSFRVLPELRYISPQWRVPFRYRMIRLIACQCCLPGFDINLAHSAIAARVSILVSLTYSSFPTALA